MSQAQNGCGVTRPANGSGTRPRRSPRQTGFAGMLIRNRDWSRRSDRDQRQNGVANAVAVAVPVSVADGDSGGAVVPQGVVMPTRFVAMVPGTAQVSGADNRTK